MKILSSEDKIQKILLHIVEFKNFLKKAKHEAILKNKQIDLSIKDKNFLKEFCQIYKIKFENLKVENLIDKQNKLGFAGKAQLFKIKTKFEKIEDLNNDIKQFFNLSSKQLDKVTNAMSVDSIKTERGLSKIQRTIDQAKENIKIEAQYIKDKCSNDSFASVRRFFAKLSLGISSWFSDLSSSIQYAFKSKKSIEEANNNITNVLSKKVNKGFISKLVKEEGKSSKIERFISDFEKEPKKAVVKIFTKGIKYLGFGGNKKRKKITKIKKYEDLFNKYSNSLKNKSKKMKGM